MAYRKLDLIGDRYGRLTVIEELPGEMIQNKLNRRFRCRCDCGAIVDTYMKSLRSGGTQSCGCYRNDRTRETISNTVRNKSDDILVIGMEFGRLMVIDELPDRDGKRYVKVQCTCGTVKELPLASLRAGRVNSCGCLQREIAAQNVPKDNQFKKKHNTYDMTGEYGIGYDDNLNEFYFDKEDYEVIKDIYFSKDNEGYFANNNTLRLHRLLMGLAGENLVVDHINGHRNDCRKENMRIATYQQNAMNRSVSSKSATGVTGVSKTKSGKYRAYITFQGKHYNLGTFDDLEGAKLARQNAELIYFGDYRKNG